MVQSVSLQKEVSGNRNGYSHVEVAQPVPRGQPGTCSFQAR